MMKDFYRTYPQVALCGLNCLLCPMNIGGWCPGCGGGEGNQSCPRARCARERNIGDFCYRCEQYPCELYEWMGDYDSFVPTRRRGADLDRVRELGPETYVRELEEKRAILELLVGEWNDGRKKSFYTTAVYLLELDDLRHAVQQVTSLSTKEMSEKERAACMTQALQKIAEQQGLVLKLNKKQKRRSRGKHL